MIGARQGQLEATTPPSRIPPTIVQPPTQTLLTAPFCAHLPAQVCLRLHPLRTRFPYRLSRQGACLKYKSRGAGVKIPKAKRGSAMGSLLSSFMSLKMKIGAVGRGRLWNLKAAPQSAKAFCERGSGVWPPPTSTGNPDSQKSSPIELRLY